MILRELLAQFGIDFDTKQLSAADKGIAGLKSGVQALGAVIAGNYLIQGIRNFANGLEQAGSYLNDTSTSLGITTTQLQELQYAAKQTGVDAGQLTIGLQMISKAGAQAAEGGKAQAALFRRLGVETRDASGHVKDAATLFRETGVALEGVGDSSERTRYALALFGRQGRILLPLFDQVNGGIDSMVSEFHALGGGLSQELIDDADKYGDNVDKLDTAFTGLKSLIGVYLLPVLTELVIYTIKGVAAFHELAEGTHVVQLGLIAFAGAAAVAGAAMLAPFAETLFTLGLVIVVVGVLILAVDDLITLFEGGQSVIGDFIDQMLGAGSAALEVASLKTAWEQVLLTIDEATDAAKRFFGEQIPDRGAEFAGRNAAIEAERIASYAQYNARAPERAAQNSGPGGVSTVNRQAIIDAATAQREGRGAAPALRRVPAAPSRRGGGGSVTIQSPTTITVPGAGDPEAVAERVARRIDARRDTELRQAHDALTQGIEEGE